MALVYLWSFCPSCAFTTTSHKQFRLMLSTTSPVSTTNPCSLPGLRRKAELVDSYWALKDIVPRHTAARFIISFAHIYACAGPGTVRALVWI